MLARAERPVVLVQDGGTTTGDGCTPANSGPPVGDIVLGLDLRVPADAVIGYAFEAATLCAAALRVVQG